MELAKIENLLEAYFEGNTSLTEEATLHSYFESNDVAPHLEVYVSMFESFQLAKTETSQRDFSFEEAPKKNNRWWYSIAALLVVSLTVAGFVFTTPGDGLTAEEKAALAAYQEVQSSMQLLSQNLNEGTAAMTHLNEFKEGAQAISVLNQFNETTNRILK